MSGTAAADDFSAGAGKFVESMEQKTIDALTEDGITREIRVRRFRGILNEFFAVKAIGQWVLGRYWRRTTPTQREEYLRLFEDLIVFRFIDLFSDYSGENLTVVKTLTKGKDAIVYSLIGRPGGQEPLKVNWRVRSRKNGQYRIIDVIVEGISMGQTQRSEFGSVFRKNGGRFDAFLTELREQVNKNV